MDLSASLMGLGLLLLFMGPIIYLIVIQNKKQKAKTKKLYEISRNHNLNITGVETTGMLALGVDPDAKQLVVVEPLNNNNSAVIDLQEVKSCKIKTAVASQKENNYIYVGLDLIGRDSGKKVFEISFFDDEQDLNLEPEAELIRARKWQGLLEKHL